MSDVIDELTTWALHDLWSSGNLTYKMHAGQTELRDLFWASTARKSAWNCSRRFGKSTLLCALALEHAMTTPGARVVYAAPTRDMARDIVLPLIDGLLVDCPPALRPSWIATEHRYRFSNGAEIKIDGADDERGNHLRGTSATLILADEVGFWRHATYVINSVLLPQTLLSGGRIVIASTPPESVGHEFWALANEARENGTYSERTIHANPMVTPALLAEFARESGGEHTTAWRREYLCEAVTEADRAVLPEFDAATHVAEPNSSPRFAWRWCTIDLGMTDLTHVVWGYYDFESARHVVQRELARQYMPVSQLAPLMCEIEEELWGGHEPDRRISDNNPMEIGEFAMQHKLQPTKVRRRLVFEPARERSPEICINRLRTFLIEKRLTISPECPQLIHQARVGTWNKQRTSFDRLPGAGHLDGIAALSYLVTNWDYSKSPVPRGAYITRDDHMLSPYNLPKANKGLGALRPKAGNARRAT